MGDKLVVDTSISKAVSKPCSAVEANKLCDKLNDTQRFIGKPERFTVMSVKDYYKQLKEK